MRWLVAALALLFVTLLSACSGGAKQASPPPTTTQTQGDPAPEAPGQPAEPELVFIATPEVASVKVYDHPDGAEPILTLANPNPKYGSPRAFLIEEASGDWLKVLLPMRPNGSSGWIRQADVKVETHDFRIAIDTSARHLTVYKGKEVFLETPVAIGDRSHPTPLGSFYITEKLIVGEDQPFYGPFAFALSAYSEALMTFVVQGIVGDGQVAIHGTDDPSTVGQNVSNGCIRMYNADIVRLADTLPPAVPVEIK